jgi:hypothetical protein
MSGDVKWRAAFLLYLVDVCATLFYEALYDSHEPIHGSDVN